MWTGLSLLWAPVAGPAVDGLQRALLYLGALAAAVPLLRAARAARAVEPALLAGGFVVACYALSERLVPGIGPFEPSLLAGDRLNQPLTYWNALGAWCAIGLVLAAGVCARRQAPGARCGWPPRRARRALGLALYLTFSRGALGAAALGLVALVALAPEPRTLRAAAIAAVAAALPALAVLALPGVERSGRPGRRGHRHARGARGHDGRRRGRRAGGSGAPARAAARAAPRRARGGRGGARRRLRRRQRRAFARARGRDRRPLRVGPEQPLRLLGGGARARSPTIRCWARAQAASPSSGCASARSTRACATCTRSTSRRPRSWASSGSLLLAAFLAGAGGVAARARGETAAIAALIAYALHAGLDWDWEMPALTLVADRPAGGLAATPALSARSGSAAAAPPP